LTALMLFPQLVKIMTRKKIFALGIGLIVAGYLLFMSVGYILPMNMVFIGLAGLVLFSGQGFIQVLVLVMLADTIEYGQWKLGTRNESVIFAINPFVTKLATSVQTFVVTLTLAVSGLNSNVIKPITDEINTAREDGIVIPVEDIRQMVTNTVTPEMLLSLRTSMIIIPLLLILASYAIYRWKYKIDTKFYAELTQDLADRILNKEKE
jgi:melibiose permease